MRKHDQPTIFGDKLIVAVSSVEDGPMNFRGNDPAEIQNNRIRFLDAVDGIDVQMTTLVRVTFEDTTDFTRYRVVEDEHGGEGMLEPTSSLEADALVATRPHQALFLPLADCVGAVLFDPVTEVVMVSHLGRHSILQEGAARSVAYLADEFGCRPADLQVWLSPAAGKEDYPLHDLGGKGLHETVVAQLAMAGVAPGAIEVSHVDTTEDPEYFSHSEFLKGNRLHDGRFAIVAMMVE